MLAEHCIGLPFDWYCFAANHAAAAIDIDYCLDCSGSLMPMLVAVCLRAFIVWAKTARGRLCDEDFAAEID